MRSLALVLASILVIPAPLPAHGAEPECALPLPAPSGSARLRWRAPGQGEGEGSRGVWVSDPAMQRAAEKVAGLEDRIKVCVDHYSTCRVDLEFEKARVRSPKWWIWAVGVGAGVVGGFYLGRSLR